MLAGPRPGSPPTLCSNCGGTGKVRRAHQSIFGQFVQMAVQYVETESYNFANAEPSPDDPADMMVHLVLSGPLYEGYLAREAGE